MARTKQTARKSCAQKVPRRLLIAQKIARKSMKIQNNESDSEPEDANTQQFSLKFDDQEKCQRQHVIGEIVKCQQCQAILTAQGTVLEKAQYESKKKESGKSDAQRHKFLKSYDKIWICEFCTHHNNIRKGYVRPALDNPCYLIEKAEEKKAKQAEESVDDSERVLIFCIDISGSMDFVPVGAKQSRLGAVRAAITDQISRMKVEKDKIKVGLITFGGEVNLIGDGTFFKQITLDRDSFDNFAKIVKITSKINNFCRPVSQSFKKLKTLVQCLRTSGITALGPGLLSSVELASKGAVGSKVIICTDGEANLGLSDDQFYDKVSDFAKKKRVMVNVLALKGDNCNLKQLGKLSLATGGAILKIDPAVLGTEFAKITKDEVLGTESFMTIKLNRIFNFCNADSKDVSKDKTTLVRDFGNFTADTELTFEFEVIDYQEACKNPNIDETMFNRAKVPMQVQLTYTGRNGSKFLQVITDWRQLTTDQKAIFEGANFSTFAASVLQRASKSIKDSDFNAAQKIIDGYWSSVKIKFSKTQKKEDLDKFADRVRKLQRVLNSKTAKAQRGGSVGKSGASKAARQNKDPSRSRQKLKVEIVDSDSEEQCLVNNMRARSNSRSRSRSASPPSNRKSSMKTKNARITTSNIKVQSVFKPKQSASRVTRSKNKPK